MMPAPIRAHVLVISEGVMLLGCHAGGAAAPAGVAQLLLWCYG
jgi:hypothetical protein